MRKSERLVHPDTDAVGLLSNQTLGRRLGLWFLLLICCRVEKQQHGVLVELGGCISSFLPPANFLPPLTPPRTVRGRHITLLKINMPSMEAKGEAMEIGTGRGLPGKTF